MVRITIEDIVFFIFIAIIVGTSLWLMSGSPSEMNAIISIGIAVAGSELLIWKYIFNMDKKTAISFAISRSEINNRFDNLDNNINKRLDKIERKL